MKKENKKEKKQKKTNITVYLILRFLVILCMVEQALKGNWHSVALCFLTLILFTLPTIASRTFKVNLPTTLEIIIYIESNSVNYFIIQIFNVYKC